MKIITEKQSLLTALSNVQRSASQKSPMPALEGILFKTEGSRVNLTGYDLEMGITTSVDAQVEQPGAVVLSAKLLVDIVRRMPGDTLSIDSDEKDLTVIKSGRSAFKLMGIPAADFPDIPEPGDDNTVVLPQYLLKNMISQTRYAISQSDSMPVHKGSLFVLDGEIFDLVSVDGCRLAMREEKFPNEQTARFIVPGKTLTDVEKMLSDDEDSAEQVEIGLSKKHVVFRIGDYRIISRLLEGNFLDYRNVIPKTSSTHVTVSTREMIDAIERASLIVEDRLKNPLHCRFENNAVTLTVNTAMGHAEDTVDCAIDGDPVTIGFDAVYLLGALKNTGCDKVTLQLSGSVSPMKIVPAEGEHFTFLVLPVRIKG